MPANTMFPEFVPDQVLTSDDLNEMFRYIDEGERLTRSNLVGIGIVCGLGVKTPAARNSITVTKGVGISSGGYLIRFDQDTVYTAVKSFDTVKPVFYDKLVKTTANPKTPRFTLLELIPDTTGGGTNLSEMAATLDQYVVLLFVELLQEQNKNCDPNSCDDKGINTTVTIRALLVLKDPETNLNSLNSLLGATGNPLSFSPFYSLPEMRMPRFDVTNTSPVQSEDILRAYIHLLNDDFLTKLEAALSGAYTVFSAFLGAAADANPFAGLKASFSFIQNIITKQQLLHLQYYYDIIADLLLAYDEFRKAGNEILSTCCPDAGLFPRHLLLGEAVPTHSLISSNRHYFIYSPLFEKKNLILHLRFLFSRMEAMKNNIFLPPFVSATEAPHDDIRITPSVMNDVPLSKKAIPYYYKPSPLYPAWSFDKTLRSKPQQNLSYHGPQMNSEDDFVSAPLKFDLEPYNFLRIEGHIGMKYTTVVEKINSLRKSFRLPIEVVALSTGEVDLTKTTESTVSCNIRDLETSYEIIRREWEAVIGKTIDYLQEHQVKAGSLLSASSMGSPILNDYLTLLAKAKTFMVIDLKLFISQYHDFLVPVYEQVEAQSEQMRRALVDVINGSKPLDKEMATLAEDLVDHFDEVVLSCKKGGFRSISQLFNSRLDEIYGQMFFSRFTENNPGIQHKAGVPMGGTFVVVYHKKPASKDLKGRFTIRGFAHTTTGAAITNGVVQVNNATPNTNVMLDINGAFTLVVNSLPAIIRVTSFSTTFSSTFTIGELLVSAPPTSPVTVTVPSAPVVIGGATTIYNSLQDDDVIADFYLPYICSSNCTPIQFVINQTVNQSPVANAGPDQEFALPRNTTMLDGRQSKDPEGKPLHFLWTLVSHQVNIVFSDATSAQPLVSGLNEPGDYVFELTVTDESGASSHADQVTIRVTAAPNIAPVAHTGDPVTITQPDSTVTLSAWGEDPEAGRMNFAWTKQSGPASATFSNGSGSIANKQSTTTAVSNLVPGFYVFRFTVTDDHSATAFADVTVTVNRAINQPPVAVAGGPLDIALPTSFVQLNGSRSTDPEVTTLAFLWEAVGNSLPIFNPRSAQPIVYDIATANNYTVRLIVTDGGGLTGTDNCLIRVIGEGRVTCLSLQKTEGRFTRFSEDTSSVFNDFIARYSAVSQITDYFQRLQSGGIADKTVPDQLLFFSTPDVVVEVGGQLNKVTIISALLTWLPPLFDIVRDQNTDKTGAIAMNLYNILVSVGMYIACIQGEHIDAVEVNTANLFKLIADGLSGLAPDFVMKLNNEQLLLLFALRASVADEIRVIEAKGEQVFKKAYIKMLKQILSTLNALLTA